MTAKQFFIILGLGISAVALWALWRALEHIDVRLVIAELRHVSLNRFSAAAGLTCGYLVINSFNEVIVCRALGQRLGIARPLTIAAIANSIGHSVGLATLSAGALRLRLYSAIGVGPHTIASIIALSALPFLLGAMCLIAIAMSVHPTQLALALGVPEWLIVGSAAVALVALVTLLGMTRHQQRALRIGRVRVPLPTAGFLTTELLLGAAEIILVASVLYLFIPVTAYLNYLNFIGMYLLAIVLGQLSNTPAGIGVFEAALLMLLPAVPTQQLLAAIISYRVVFELLPLLLALLLLLAFELGSPAGWLGRWWRSGVTREHRCNELR